MPRSTARVHAPTRITKTLTFEEVIHAEALNNQGICRMISKTVEGDYYGYCRISDLEVTHD